MRSESKRARLPLITGMVLLITKGPVPAPPMMLPRRMMKPPTTCSGFRDGCGGSARDRVETMVPTPRVAARGRGK